MKYKYNKSNIFKRAWFYVKAENLNLSDSLKKSWRIEKNKIKINIKDYMKLINKMAWIATKKWKTEFEEAQSQAYLIFYEALEKYDNDKSSFCTFLTIQLKGYLNLYFKRSRFNIDNEYIIDNDEDTLFKKFCIVLEFYDHIISEFDQDSQLVLKYILSEYGKVKMTKYNIMNYFRKFYNWTILRVNTVFESIKNWWLVNKGYYCV